MLQHIKKGSIYSLACGFGSGLLPTAPGTWGTLVGLFCYIIFLHKLPVLYYTTFIVSSFFAGIVLCQWGIEEFKHSDPAAVVWDEMVGYWITVLFIPGYTPWWVFCAFISFRLFDVFKPWPIYIIDQRIKNGLGVMLDDAFAALYAGLLLLLMGSHVTQNLVLWLKHIIL